MMNFTSKYSKNNDFFFLSRRQAVFRVFRFVLNFRDFSVLPTYSSVPQSSQANVYLAGATRLSQDIQSISIYLQAGVPLDVLNPQSTTGGHQE